MLEQLAKKYYEENYNCAETIIRAGNEYYQLGLSDEAMKAFGGFGGGMQCGQVCGGLTGAIGVISSKYIEKKAHETKDLRNKVQTLIRNYRTNFNSLDCKDIKQHYYDPQTHCLKTVIKAAEVLEKTIQQFEEEDHA